MQFFAFEAGDHVSVGFGPVIFLGEAGFEFVMTGFQAFQAGLYAHVASLCRMEPVGRGPAQPALGNKTVTLLRLPLPRESDDRAFAVPHATPTISC
jgi:hypothetical protein